MSDAAGEPSPTSLAAEAAAFRRARECDGSDRHPLGWSPATRASTLAGAITLVVLVVRVDLLSRFVTLSWGLLLGVVIVAGMSTSVVGDELRINRFGWRRRIRFASVRRVERYEYRSAVSLRLWDAGDERLPSIPISGLAYRISPTAAAHVLRYLDQPDVSWGPGAWDTLRQRAGSSATYPTADDAAPSGRQVSGKPMSGWAKAGLYFSGVMSVVAVVVLIVLVPVTWRGYLESQRIQHGPSALATLQQERTTETSDRSGTHHTTHFLVNFTTQAGQQVTTTVDAHGRYRVLDPGFRFAVRYDPGSPRRAELPGRPMNSLATAVFVTVFAGVALVTLVSIGTVVLRARRRRRELTGLA